MYYHVALRFVMEVILTTAERYEQACLLKNEVIVNLSSTDIYKREFEVSGGITFSLSETELLDIIEKGGIEYQMKTNSYGTAYDLLLEVNYKSYITIMFESNINLKRIKGKIKP